MSEIYVVNLVSEGESPDILFCASSLDRAVSEVKKREEYVNTVIHNYGNIEIYRCVVNTSTSDLVFDTSTLYDRLRITGLQFKQLTYEESCH